MKINNQEYLELQGNEFYKILLLVYQPKDDSKWLGKVRVIRLDTIEFIKSGFFVYEQDKETLMEKIKRRVEESLFPELEKAGAPSDWNSEIRKIFVACKDVTSRLMRFGHYSVDHASEQNDEDNYSSNYAQYWQEIIRDTIAVNSMVEALDDQKRIELLTITDTSLENPSDPWSLDDIDFRIRVFDFLSSPTEQEKRHHELQREKLSNRFKELGWSPEDARLTDRSKDSE